VVRVSWTRALSGDWRDPVVGRDVLIGCAAGVALACLDRVSLVLPGWLGRPEVFPSERSIGYAFAPGVSPFRLLDAVGWSIGDALMTLVVYLLLRIVLRSDRAAAVGGITMLTAATAFATLNGVVVFPVVLARAALTLVVVVRAGLLALIVAMFTAFAFLLYPMTFGFTAWYSSIGFTVLLVLVTQVVYGFLVSVQGHRLLDIESATAKRPSCPSCSSGAPPSRSCRSVAALLSVVEDDAQRVPPAGTQPAHAVPHIDAIGAPRSAHRAMMNGKGHCISLPQWNDFDARLQSRPLLGQHEVAASEIAVRL
jgi:hypothetical protein